MKTIKKLIITATIATCLAPMPHMHAMHNSGKSQDKQEMRNGRLEIRKNQILNTKNERQREELLDELEEDNDINHQNKRGETLLMEAIRKNNEPLVKLLLERYLANPRKADSNGISPLIAAVHQNSINLVDSLMISDENLDLEATDSDGDTALLIAVRNGNFEIVQKLIAAGANVDHTNNNGNTALMIATCVSATTNNDAKMVQLLLNESIITICHANADNHTPLDKALFEDRRGLATLLLNHGAKPHDKNALKHIFQFIDLPDNFITSLILAGAQYEKCCSTIVDSSQYRDAMHIRDSFLEQNYELEDYQRERESFITELPGALINQGDDIIKLIGEYSSPYPANISEIKPEIAKAALAEMACRKKVRSILKQHKQAQQRRKIQKQGITPAPSKATSSAAATSAKTTSSAAATSAKTTRNAAATPTQTRTITCHVCTFDNNVKNTSCEICLAPLSAQAPAQQIPSKTVSKATALAADETIVCSQCTFLNPASTEQCAMCTASLRDTSSDDETDFR